MEQIVTFVRIMTYMPETGEQIESQLSLDHIVAVQPFVAGGQDVPFDIAEATSVMLEGRIHFVVAMPYDQTVKVIQDAMGNAAVDLLTRN